MNYHTNVTNTDMLDEDIAEGFKKPWLVEHPNGLIEEYDTEEEACARQRDIEKTYLGVI